MTKTVVAATCLGCWLLTSGLYSPLLAQAPASTLAELRSSIRLTEGESVQILGEDGKTVSGKLAGILEHAIAIVANGDRREIPESTIREVRRLRPDTLGNGLLIGLGAGAVGGVLSLLVLCADDSECQANTALILIPVGVGIGAGAGAGVDAAIRKYETVYAAPIRSTRVGIRVSPVLSNHKKGLRVAFSF